MTNTRNPELNGIQRATYFAVMENDPFTAAYVLQRTVIRPGDESRAVSAVVDMAHALGKSGNRGKAIRLLDDLTSAGPSVAVDKNFPEQRDRVNL